MRRLLAAFASLACVVAVSGFTIARADDAFDAKDLFSKARVLRQGGHCDQAVPMFRKAYRLLPNGLGSILNLAQCEEELSMWASSHRDWLELSRALLTSPDRTTKYVGWDADADAGAKRTAPKVAKLTLHIVKKGATVDVDVDADTLKSLVVTINGQPLDAPLLATELDRDPGSYEVVVTGGKEPAHGNVVLAAGEAKSLNVAVEIPAEPAVVVPPPKPPPLIPVADPIDHDATKRAFGWGFVTVGAVGAVGTIVSIVVRQSALGKVKSECGADYASHACPTDLSSTVQRGKTASTLVDVFGAVAIVGLGVGIPLLVTSSASSDDSAKKSAPQTSIELAPFGGITGGGAALVGSF